ncbi:hypothetical protein LTS03_010025 [Exophiala xenobiotica]|nr:hypothetical protein LTR41_001957 [Exophiala xenobiotica]KAK5362275.1 hypothetical protein LTS03_010025 [Exophiala xenobiotica]
MDLERIKQNLRIRSGRSKKSRKPATQPTPVAQAKASDQTGKAAGTVKQPPEPTKQTYSPAKEEPSLRNWNAHTALPPIDTVDLTNPRPGLPHAATGSYPKPSPSGESARYGRSGIEKPHRGPSSRNAPKGLQLQRTMSESDTKAKLDSDTSDALDFDLRPPPPRPKPPSVESLSESLFSTGHLNALIHNPQYLARFTAFIGRYRPQYYPIVLRYLETQKAIKAVEYANAIAHGLDSTTAPSDRPTKAALLDKDFEEWNNSAFRTLVDEALPMYITYNLVKVVTECLINEITGRQTPLMRDLVGGLSEVFCLTDPKQQDNPIIYASEEFYRLTGYGSDDVIGHNCRFLQGTKTKRESVSRLRETIRNGEQICETLLNYRRDGRPFINLLMIAPLHDDKGNVKYMIGAQVDVTGLVDRGKGLNGFEKFVVNREIEKRDLEINGNRIKGETARKSRALTKLRELSEMFDLEESAAVRSHSRSTSRSRDEDERSIGSRSRRVYGDEDGSSEESDDDPGDNDDKMWKLAQSGRSGLSGKLPGVYDSYMLIRAAPSLRIVFLSPKLRQRLGNIVQHPFLSHIAASSSTLAGLKESLGTGIPVSAKVNFMLKSGERRDGTKIPAGSKPDSLGHHRVCWLSATPLVGSDDRIGVWMVVIVEKSKVPKEKRAVDEASNEPSRSSQPLTERRLQMLDNPAGSSSRNAQISQSRVTPQSDQQMEDMPIKPKRLAEDVGEVASERVQEPTQSDQQKLDVDKHETMEDQNQTQQIEEPEPAHMAPDDAAQKPEHQEEPSPTKQGAEDMKESDNEFVRTKSPPGGSPKKDRVVVRPDSAGEPKAPTTSELDDALVRSFSNDKVDIERLESNSPKDSGFQEVSSHFNDFSDNEETPRKSQQSEHWDRTPPQSQFATSANDSSKANATNYMDYISHPGSRHSSEYKRPMSGSVRSSMYLETAEKDGQDDFVDDSDDVDCCGLKDDQVVTE